MPRLIIVVAACCIAAFPLVAKADTEADAKAAYKKGREHYKAERYAEAVEELKKAYALKPHPVLLRYMGDSYFKMNDARQAIHHYKLYLKEAPQAADRDKVAGKVRQLELIVGASEEEAAAPPPPPPAPAPAPEVPPPAPPTEPGPARSTDLPTGDDKEVPLGLRQPGVRGTHATPGATDKAGISALGVMKWVALGVGVAGLAMGITFNRLAASKASELEDAVRTECPPTDPNCGGNPDMNDPKVRFSETHFTLQQDFKQNNTISIVSFVAAAVGASAATLFFVLDRPPQRAAGHRRVGIAPVLGAGYGGIAGEVTF